MIQWNNARRRWNTLALRMTVLLIGIVLIAYTEALERFDFIIYDKLSTLRHYPQDPNIAIVAIDEESFKVLGRWPWSRGVHAELIRRLTSIDNKVVALDILFSEAQKTDPYADHLLAQAIAAHGHVIFPVAPIAAADSESITLAQPLPLFSEQAVFGHVDVELDSDGVARRVFLYAGINAPMWPALGLALADPATAKKFYPSVHADNETPQQKQHWVRSHEVLIPYTAYPGDFRKISYAQVLFDDDALASLRNKTVIVGMTAVGMGTRFATPISPLNRQPMTGVEWHANVFSMLTNDRAIHPASTVTTAIIAVFWVTGILALIVLMKIDFTIPLLLGALIVVVFLAGTILALNHAWIPPGAALLGTLALYPLWNWQRINQFLHSLWITKVRSNTALESIRDGVIITDASNHVIYINKGAEKILQTQLNQIKGKLLQEILGLHAKIGNALVATQAEMAIPDSGPEQSSIIEGALKTAHGNERTVRIVRNQLYDEREIMMGSVIAMTDITDNVELTRQVAYQQSYDALTKLPNRSRLLTQFDQMIKALQNTEKIITVFFVTLDNFKKINDAMGHHAGDKLLEMTSKRLFDIMHAEDVVARWAGDEFVVLSDHFNKENLPADMAQKILDSIGQRFEIDGLEVFVSVSIGISSYPEHGLTSETVLERAGTAMYRVKRDGGNHFGFYLPESSVVWTRDQLELERELRAAIKNGELQVLFQPIVDAKSYCISHMEALVRWPHPQRGYLSPSEFIPLAEDIGQIEQLGELVLRVSCVAARKLSQLGYPVVVSVNVNPRQLSNRNFTQTISQVLRDTGLPAKFLTLEITESAIVNDMERAGEVLKEIKDLDILIALDDFGTGYSSLTLLRDFPIDILKIDKTFVRTLDQNLHDLKIVQAMIGLGKNLGLTVIAEGVETERQVGLLLQHECHIHQGYYFSRPTSYEALFELIRYKFHN
jgi:diguanylate cyclase (GGDEF)-like protein/PAS domain S-box-containing protein